MHCFKFLRGACEAGDTCRWAHLTPEEVEAKKAKPKAKAASSATTEVTPTVALQCLVIDSEDHDDDSYMLTGMCAEICAVSADDDDIKILIGRRHKKSKISAPRNLLMPDERADTRTKDQVKEQRNAEKGEETVPVKVPHGYLRSKAFQIRSEMAQKIALRKAELLRETLVIEKQEEDYIVEDFKGQVFQILVIYDE
jgi:hypothetical protein